MNAIRISRRRIAAVSAAALAAVAAAGMTSDDSASAHYSRTLQLTNVLDSIVLVGGPPPKQAVGGAFYVHSHVVTGGEGTTDASCVVTSTLGAGVRQCEVDMVLDDGILTTRGLTDLANSTVTLVVTGGTGRYAVSRGTGTLTPTPTGSEVVLRLR